MEENTTRWSRDRNHRHSQGTGSHPSSSSSLLRALSERSATGKCEDTKLWAEEEGVKRQQLEYLDLATDTTKSTIAVAFSPDG